jgi:uncharacterized protein DUF5753/helix-turn-helix protein
MAGGLWSEDGSEVEVPVDYRAPNINARRLGSYLRLIREEALALSYEEAAAQVRCASEWLVRVETGFESPTPAEVERILERYNVREAKLADVMIDLASRPAGPPWLAAHVDRLKASTRDILILESEASIIRSHRVLWAPELTQAEPYARHLLPYQQEDCDVDLEWELLASRQRYRPGGRRRVLDVILDAGVLTRLPNVPEVMIAQLRHLLDLSLSPDVTIRLIPEDAPWHEGRIHPFDVLEFPEVNDRITVVHHALGIDFGRGDAGETWTAIKDESAVSPAESRALIRRRLAELTAAGNPRSVGP